MFLPHTPSALGVLIALVMYVISVSPSLLPRRWYWHAFVSGIMTGLGYAVGWMLQNLGYQIFLALGIEIHVRPVISAWGPWVLLSIFAVWVFYSVVRAGRSAYRQAVTIGMPPVGVGEFLLGLLGTAATSLFVIAIVRVAAGLFVSTVNFFGRWIPFIFAWAAALAILVGVVFFVSNKVVFRVGVAFFAREAAKRDNRTASGVYKPELPQRSGSPDSYVSWEQAGAQGRTFLGRGPSQEDIAAVMGEAMEPIRLYVGRAASEGKFSVQTELLLREMERAGAFEREHLLVYTSTGSGWVNDWVVEPMEYLTCGNCATVSMQYSYMFSAAIFVTEMDMCREAGAALFEAVYSYVQELPEARRPKLYVAGESLGAEGAQAPFANFDDLVSRVDGALFVGAPSGANLSKELTRGRHRGSPEVSPVYDSGRHVRFVNEPKQLSEDLYGRELGVWESPRIAFIQHASDPVVWYNVPLMVREPDWLRERVGLDVSPNMRYTPFVTYLQVLADMPMAGTAPGGHGHTYEEELVSVWIAVLCLEDQINKKTTRAVEGAIRQNIDESGFR